MGKCLGMRSLIWIVITWAHYLDSGGSLPNMMLSALAILFLRRHRAHEKLPPSPSALPIIGHLHHLGPLIHQSFRDISRRYGPLFYLQLGSVPCVVASTPDMAKELLKTHEATFSARKHSLAIEKMTYNSSFAFAPIAPYWKFVKKLSTTELVGYRMLSQFQPLRRKELNCFLQHLLSKSKAGETVNLTQELVKLTNNIISQMMLSMRCSGTDGQAEEARSLVREVTLLFGTFNVSDFIWLCKNIDLQGFRKKIDRVHKRYDALLEKIITEREMKRRKEKFNHDDDKEENRLNDFLDVMLDAMEDENSEIQLTREHIKALVLDFFTAGTDTSATALDWAVAELINNPKVLEKARKEIDGAAGENRIVEESDIHQLPYIQAIIKETLRLHPPIPMVSRKSTEDCYVQGYKIPAKTLLFVNTWAIGRDPRHWERPLEFLPERFLPGNGREKENLRDVKGHHFELLPFGTGRRGCPGISLAMLELTTTLSAITQCFDFNVVGPNGVTLDGGGAVDMSERPGLTAPRDRDLICIPVARGPIATPGTN